MTAAVQADLDTWVVQQGDFRHVTWNATSLRHVQSILLAGFLAGVPQGLYIKKKFFLLYFFFLLLYFFPFNFK
jgi:hypothetical protein